MDTKHTEGPWEVIEYGPNAGAVRIGEIIVEGAYRGGDSDVLSLVDARLIAAAPELLEALMLVEERFGAHCIDPLPMDLCELVVAAIAKATGAQS